MHIRTRLANDNLRKSIRDAVARGKPFSLDYNEILEHAEDVFKHQPVIPVTVDLADGEGSLHLGSLSQLASLLGGHAITSVVPDGILPGCSLSLESVGFTLLRESERIGSLACTVTLSSSEESRLTRGPRVLPGVDIGGLNIGLDRLSIRWVEPLTSQQRLQATAYGHIKITPKVALATDILLDVSVSLPDATATIQLRDGSVITLGELFQQLGLHLPKTFEGLILTDLVCCASLGDKFVDLRTELASKDPVILVKDVLSLKRIALDLSHSAGQTTAALSSRLVCKEKLALNVSADLDTSSGRWKFAGEIDIPQTSHNLHPDPGGVGSECAVTVGELADIFVPGSGKKIPDILSDISIEDLTFDYMYAGEGSADWRFGGTVSEKWELLKGVEARLQADISDDSKSVQGEFKVDGFGFTLGWKLSCETSEFFARILALGLEGTYDTNSETLRGCFAKELGLGRTLAWFVASVTGNRHFRLVDPWGQLLDKLYVPAGSSLEFNLKTGHVKIEIGDPTGDPPKFFGRIRGVTITYSRDDKQNGKSGLSISMKVEFPSQDPKTLAWDPASQEPPIVPGHGAAILDIELAAVGQHVGLKSTPGSVKEGIDQVSKALADWDRKSHYPKDLSFGRSIGWLIGTHLYILGQVDIQFLFSDPAMYGLVLDVQNGKNKKLNLLAGLHAEILYRKVTDTVGEYSGTLVLPDNLRIIHFNGLDITLPSIYLAVYTNGGFKIDVGFPHNRDFSHSFSVTSGQYSGAGGFYYAKLDGLNPRELPQVAEDIGVFSPITEIGIGFRIGVVKSFRSGPLFASFSVMLEGLFEGVFATFTRYKTDDGKPTEQCEYYSVKATVAVVGHLVGKIDFNVIKASVDVTVFIEASLLLEACKATLVSVEAGVSVKLTVTVNCGIFKIHIHCSFATTIREQLTIGKDSPAPWQVDGQLHSPPRAALATGIRVGWQPIHDEAPLTVFFLPQLTAGRAYPTPDAATFWYYVGQLGLSHPKAICEHGPLANEGPDSYTELVLGLVRWALYAIDNEGSTSPVEKREADEKTVTQEQVAALLDRLADDCQPEAFDDIRLQFFHGFQTMLCPPPTDGVGNELAIGFFPLVPEMVVSIQVDGAPPQTLTAASLSDSHLRSINRGGPDRSLPANSPAQSRETDEHPAGFTKSAATRVLEEYVLVLLRSGLQRILDIEAFGQQNGEEQKDLRIGDILKRLEESEEAISQISGATSHFLLHGTRLPPEDLATGEEVPLYALTRQQGELKRIETAKSIAVSISFDLGPQAEWEIRFQDGGDKLTLSSDDPSSAIYRPEEIRKWNPMIDPDTPFRGALPSVDRRPRRFFLHTGVDVQPEANSECSTLWRLPQELMACVADGETHHFELYYEEGSALGLRTPQSEGPVPPEQYEWALCVDFRVRRIPIPSEKSSTAGTANSTPGGDTFFGNTYELVHVDPVGVLLLEELVEELNTEGDKTPIAELQIAYLKPGGRAPSRMSPQSAASEAEQGALFDVDFIRTFIVQTNFSTETHPPTRAKVSAPRDDEDARALFLTKLWSGGITNTGGYYLFHSRPKQTASGDDAEGLPTELFAEDGTATLTLVVRFGKDGVAGSSLPRYATHAFLHGETEQEPHPVLYVQAPDVLGEHSLLPAGRAGVRIVRKPRSAPLEDGYAADLDALYAILSGSVEAIGGSPPRQQGRPASIGPIAGDDEGQTYEHAFPLVETCPPPCAESGFPPEKFNPYQYVGDAVSYELGWTDLFGNQCKTFSLPTAPVLKYHDQLISLAELPYLAFDYSFRSAADPSLAELAISFYTVDPDYTGEDPESQWENDRDAYRKAYYQLLRIHNGQYTTTCHVPFVDPDKKIDVVKTVRENIGKIYDWLLSKRPVPARRAGSPESLPALEEVAIGFDPHGEPFGTETLVPIMVTFDLERTGPIDDSLGQDYRGPIRRITIPIPPAVHPDEEGGAHGLKEFAAQFEGVFSGLELKLAVGPVRKAGQAADGQQLWSVRWSMEGILPQFLEPKSYYAPRPLSTTLLSRQSIETRLLSDSFELTEERKTTAVADVDLDVEMRKCLAAIDELMSPEYSVPAALVLAEEEEHGFSTLCANRKKLVEHLVQYVEHLGGAESPESIETGKDRYRQECLTRLSAFYEMSAVAALLAENRGNKTKEPLKILWEPIVKGSGSDEEASASFTLTSGKFEVAASPQPTAIGVFPSSVKRCDRYETGTQWSLQAIEHGIKTISAAGNTYEVGSWLKFVLPVDPLAVPGDLEIPIPLRVFPTPPRLTRQYSEFLIDQAAEEGITADTALELAKSWSLDGEYQLEYAAQDTLYVEARINAAASQRLSGDIDPTSKLLKALIEFNSLYPALRRVLDDKDLRGKRTPEDAQDLDLKNSLVSFVRLVDAVVQSWGARRSEHSHRVVSEISWDRVSRYVVEDGYEARHPEDDWQSKVAVCGDGQDPKTPLPQLRISGCKTVLAERDCGFLIYKFVPETLPGSSGTGESDDYLKAVDAWQIPFRTLAVCPIARESPPLSVLDSRNGQLALKLVRNRELPEAFRYETAWEEYADVLTPEIDTDHPIRVEELDSRTGDPEHRSLKEHLEILWERLLTSADRTPAADVHATTLVHFAYPSSANGVGDIEVPISLWPPTTSGEIPTPVADQMAKSILAWIEKNAPRIERLSSMEFDIALFAEDWTRRPYPFLRIRNVVLQCQYVEDLASQMIDPGIERGS